MKYLVIDTTVLSEGTVNPENDIYIIGLFDTVTDALAARGRYCAYFPEVDFTAVSICPLRPNTFYTDRTPISSDYMSNDFEESEEDLLHAISDIRD